MTRPERDFSDAVCQPFMLQGGDHGVLLLHGFTGSVAHMRPLGELLHQQGFTVMGINLPGHAVSMEAMGKTGWQDWLDAAKEAFCKLQECCRYVSVAGLSMGGCLALCIAEQMHPTAIAAISAPMAARNPMLPYAKLVSPFVPRVMWRARGESAGLLDDRYDIGYPGFPTKCAGDLHHLIQLARRDLHAVQCPLLVVQSRQDGTITADSADVILNGVGSDCAGMLWLEHVPHVCTISREVGRIASACAQTFRKAEY
ncbi:MAG: alpha/beta fold hydrolase [Clostridia bacterium]|nr:alpha/beta fold hydrolase [Clostridia bacterium]